MNSNNTIEINYWIMYSYRAHDCRYVSNSCLTALRTLSAGKETCLSLGEVRGGAELNHLHGS